jgi:hypothetical protein
VSEQTTGRQVLDTPMPTNEGGFANEAGAATVGEYLIALLKTLWNEQEGFSGKRPFGNSDWDSEIIKPLITSGLLDGQLDEDGYIEDYVTAGLNELMGLAFAELGRAPEPLLPEEMPGLAEVEAGLAAVVARQQARLEWIERGADFTRFDSNTVPTEAQLWGSLLQARPEYRLTWLRYAIESSDDAHACMVQNHRARLEQLIDRCTRLEELVRNLGGEPDA